MNLSRKQIYCGLGITAGVVTIGIILHTYRHRLKNLSDQASGKIAGWLKPVSAKITSGFGYRTDPKTGKQGEFHNGIDLAVPVGTQVRSPMDGVVDLVNSGGDGGNQVIIRHTNGYRTGYAHLSKQLVKKGDKVKQGDVIALSGNSGKSTGPHLHLTMTDPSGAKIDPRKIIYTV
ncbi:MAG: M23 family metallopeptidase [Bacteroidetes bacterium]|nr:M23 family metallopeptidase [Bacteroidota bacterium]